MVLGDLIGTSDREVSLTGAESMLLAAARAAAVPGVAMAATGVIVPSLAGGLTTSAAFGGASFLVGGVLWVLAQGLVARWLSDRNPQTLFLALWCGVLGVVAAAVGMGLLAGFTGSFSQTLAVVAGSVVCGEAALVWHVDPRWVSRRRVAPTGPARQAPLLRDDEVTLLLRGTAQAGVALGVLVGVLLVGQFVYFLVKWEEDWNLIGAFGSLWFFALVGAWCAPQLVLGEWAGGPLRPPVRVLAIGAAGWAGLAWACSWFEVPFLVLPVLLGTFVVLEVVLASMIVWRRLGASINERE